MRIVLMIFGLLGVMTALVIPLVGPSWPLAVPALIGLLILAALGLERHRYRATRDAPPEGPGWEMMSERFVDSSSGELMIVWFNRASGKRVYVRSGPV